jgi:Ser/Thr protein kinase RdoA (MazF antagonist)
VIHNDFNPKNILFAAENIVGIIDFGDIVHGARAIDVGVTIARHLEAGDAMRAPPCILAGYCATSPLSRAEIDCLYAIVRARLAMRSAIGAWRLQQRDGRGDPAQIADALALLAELRDIGEAAALRAWRAAAGV